MATINFDSQFYLEQKLEQLQKQDSAEYGDWTTADVQQAFDDAGLTAEQHYEMYGYIENLSPNAQFDSTAYLEDKLAQLQATGATQADGEPYANIADVANAFQAAGLSPLEHYNLYGQDEGLTATPVSGETGGGDGPTTPTPTNTIAFDASEKAGNKIVWDEENQKMVLESEAQGDTVKHVGKAYYDENKSYNTTADYKFTLSNQLNYGQADVDGAGGVDLYQATFLSPLMVESGGIGAGSVLDLRFADRLAPANDTTQTLNNTQINYFEFTYNGTEYQVNDENTNGALTQAQSYPDLLAAIQTGIATLKAQNPELSGLNVRQGNTFSVDQYDKQTDQLTGEKVQGVSIVLSAQEGTLGGFTANVTSVDTGGVDSYARAFDTITDGVDGLIQTSIDLDNIGYGSQGGSVNIAGESATNVGIEKFVVTTKNGAWLTELSSEDTATNSDFNHLKQVEVSGTGYFRVGQQSASWGHSNTAGEYFTANGQTANWVSPFVADTTGGDQGLTDVQDVDLTGLNGSSAINAVITDAVIDRDLNLVDVNGNPAEDNVVYSYELTSGDDVLNLNVDADVLEREDFELDISTGAGNDVVHFSNDLSGSALTNQQLNNNVSIDTGAGNDRVWTEGAGNATINTGAGDDLILADNSGDQGIGTNEGRAQFVFNNASLDIDDLESNSDNGLSSGASGNAQSFTVTGFDATASSNTFGVAVNFMGYEATVNINVAASNINASGDATITALQINQAIKSAINSDDVLKELLLAKDGNGNSLIVDSKIDGAMTTDDLAISFTSNNANDGEADVTLTQDSSGAGYYDTEFAKADVTTVDDGGTPDDTSDDTTTTTATDITGADSSVESDNVINAGTGTDEIVLGTGADSNDTVAFTGYNNGDNTIVNFTDGDLATNTGADILDFTSYLGGAAANTGDVDDAAGELTNDTVYTLDFTGTDDVSFADLSASDVLNALNADSGSVGGIDSSIDAASEASDYILLVNNAGTDGNPGEVKAFHLQSGADSGDFSSVQLIGTMDFGSTNGTSNVDALHADNLA
ncbi:hypothetical protein QO259_03795 [Salinicola sp. JS01]|uniref:beta strand repeat-containing protein n=1 Tax=Salinicola sp. JS01 TaxID=3050071 RepID=UPI00255B7EBC|nr:hypothetical protein [Salinicola sp. JS01]WIX33795.1 hypothetical protein QO259_03795 [Salinicola sp. JS01]